MEEATESSVVSSTLPGGVGVEREVLRRTFVLTRETGEICGRIFQRLSDFPAPQPGGFLFSGERGVGKSHVLEFAAALLDDPQAPQWALVEPYLVPGTRRGVRLSSRFLRVPSDPGVDLAAALASQLEISDAAGAPAPVLASRLAATAARWAHRSVALVVLDDASRRFEQIGDLERIGRELGQLRRVAGALAGAGILAVVVIDGAPANEAREPATTAAVAALSGVCDFLWISRNNLLDVIAALGQTAAAGGSGSPAGALLSGPGGARLEGRSAVSLFHPQVYNTLFRLRRIVPSFSPFDFARATLASAVRESNGCLIGLDYLFDCVEPQLREVASAAPVLAALEDLRGSAVPRLKPGMRSRAETLLKAITMLTICPTEPASARALTDGLPPFDAPGLASAYGVTSAILAELEQKGGRCLLAEGERLERSYRILGGGGEVEQLRTERAAEGEACPLEFPRFVSDWIHAQVPGWATDASTRYLRASQSLVAPLPSGADGPSGTVYFKSIYDPLWSEVDLTAIGDTRAAWIVLVLSPFERYYELDPRLRELTRRLDRLLVWRPDTPLASESHRLRDAAQLLLDRDTHGSTATTAEKLAWSNAQYLAEEVLWTLYLGRGRLLHGGRIRRVADEIGSRSLGEYLAACLREIPWAVEGAGALHNVGAAQQARAWAALLAETPAESTNAEIEAAVLAAWDAIESRGLRREVHKLPDSFLTTEVARRVRVWETWLETLQPLFARLRARDLPFVETMTHVARGFGGDMGRFLAGKELDTNLAGALRWLPAFEWARDYLAGALPTGQQELEQMRSDLLERSERPHDLLEGAARERFDQTFMDYRRRYIDIYYALHEEALNLVGGGPGREAPVDYVALRNLELLSRLHYTDKSYLNRVRVIGKWVQTNQCTLPVRQILERCPRCHCNFNPSGSKLPNSVAHLNRIIQEGIEYFRAILRRCHAQIIQGLKSMQVDDYHSRQIAVLLSRGPMVPLKPQSIDILNRVIQSRAADFVAAIRAHKVRT